MNSFQMIPCAIAILATLLLPLRAFARDVSVRIPDPALEAAIRAALNNPPRDITRADMEDLTVLDASRDRTYPPTSAPIASLEGLELATNLVVLKLDGSSLLFPMGNETAALSVSDLSRLSSLTKLESLSLALNQFTTIRLPDGMSSLRTLVLEGNQQSDPAAESQQPPHARPGFESAHEFPVGCDQPDGVGVLGPSDSRFQFSAQSPGPSKGEIFLDRHDSRERRRCDGCVAGTARTCHRFKPAGCLHAAGALSRSRKIGPAQLGTHQP